MINLVELAARLRKSRLNLGLTLEQLADQAGLAKGLLSKVENFRVTPTLPTIVKLTDALGIPLSTLFEGLDHTPQVSVTRQDERLVVERDRDLSNTRYLSLAHKRPNRRMDPFELTIPGGGGREKCLSHEGEEFLMVLDGSVVLEIGDESFSLQTGDSVYFNAEIPHRAQNPHEQEAKILCVFLESGSWA